MKKRWKKTAAAVFMIIALVCLTGVFLIRDSAENLELTHYTAENAGLPESFDAARYHSLAVKQDTLPECLRVTAVAEDGEVMAVEHRDYPIFGLQFYPESVMTPQGKNMIENFMHIVRRDR